LNVAERSQRRSVFGGQQLTFSAAETFGFSLFIWAKSRKINYAFSVEKSSQMFR